MLYRNSSSDDSFISHSDMGFIAKERCVGSFMSNSSICIFGLPQMLRIIIYDFM